MRLVHIVLCVVFSLVLIFPADSTAVTLNKGFLIGNWLNPDEAVHIQTTRYQKTDFENMKALGADHVRLLVNFNTPATTSPDYELSWIHYHCLDKAISWAEELGMAVIIVNDGDEIAEGTADQIKERLLVTWKNVATRYAGKGDVVAYELYAAPGDLITAELWNGMAAELIGAIRTADSSHPVIVGPVNNYDVDSLAGLSKFDDASVIYAFELFDPVLFTRQGDSYLEVDYNTRGVPFPHDAGSMPGMAAEDAGTAAEEAYNAYSTEGNVDFVKSKIDLAVSFATTNSVPVYCTNFGAYIGTAGNRVEEDGFNLPEEDKTLWLQTVRSYFEEKSIGWCHPYRASSYGIFWNYGNNYDSWMQFYNYPYDVIDWVVEALGLTPPEDESYNPEILGEGFMIYDEEITPHARVGWWLGDLYELSFFNEEDPVSGKYCLSIFYPGQYNAVDFFFPLYLDMSALAEDGFVLDFFIRSYWETAHIQTRFEDTNEYFEERPWRMNKNIDNAVVPFDGDWQRVTLPLAEMDDQGAWDPDDQTWYGGGGGEQDWGAVQRFQLVSELEAQPDAEMFIDRLRIVHPDAIEGKPVLLPSRFYLAPNYPNPFNPTTTIEYNLPRDAEVELAIYNIRGEKVKSLVTGVKPAGTYVVQWDGTDENSRHMPSGLYFSRLQTENQTLTRRMLLIR